MHATSDSLGSKLKATSAPRKIDLAEEMALHGVDVLPQEISEAILQPTTPSSWATSSAGSRTRVRS
ncbi:hypothetical protein ACNUIM_32560 [Pseudomonas aeruginosa]|uniref:hypothetical protein n=1 Tax=Pseudomonas aeruginosa TaxID=287 RepID=UPI003AAFC03E